MFTGAITQYIDVPQILLYVFWFGFAALVLYLQRESRREGFPLRSDKPEVLPHSRVQGFTMPKPKTYKLLDGSEVQLPSGKNDDERVIAAKPIGSFFGAPLVPEGNALADGAGAASFAHRSEFPDPDGHGSHRLRLLSSLGDDYGVAEFSNDPRGMAVRTFDDEVVGTVSDIWVDHLEQLARYYAVSRSDGSTVAVPVMLTTMRKARKAPAEGSMYDRLLARRRHELRVASVTSQQFADAPTSAAADSITRREEDRIQAYFGGGHLHATRKRSESLI